MNKTPEISIIFEEMAQLFFNSRFMLVPNRQLVVGERAQRGTLEREALSFFQETKYFVLSLLPDGRFTGQISKFGREMNRWTGRNPLQPRNSD